MCKYVLFAPYKESSQSKWCNREGSTYRNFTPLLGMLRNLLLLYIHFSNTRLLKQADSIKK